MNLLHDTIEEEILKLNTKGSIAKIRGVAQRSEPKTSKYIFKYSNKNEKNHTP